MAKTFDQTLAESGQQSTLDQLRKTGGYEAAKSAFETTGTLPGQLSDAGQVTPFLSDFQSNLFQAQTAPPVKVPTRAELETQLLPEGGLPEPLKLTERFGELREEYDVGTLESTLSGLKGEEDDIFAIMRERKGIERGKPVPLGVISGRTTEIERQERENLDFVQRQKSRVVEELQLKYGVIQQFMGFENLEYQDALQRYDTKYNQNLQMYNIISGAEKEVRDESTKRQAIASANLTTMTNLITSGNVDLSQISADQVALINKLEAQAGLPVGFTQSIRKDPKSDIVFTHEKDGVVQVGFRDQNGDINVKKYGSSISPKRLPSIDKEIDFYFDNAFDRAIDALPSSTTGGFSRGGQAIA